jgi:hypothetical protein
VLGSIGKDVESKLASHASLECVCGGKGGVVNINLASNPNFKLFLQCFVKMTKKFNYVLSNLTNLHSRF